MLIQLFGMAILSLLFFLHAKFNNITIICFQIIKSIISIISNISKISFPTADQ